jgi:hypothetical protein
MPAWNLLTHGARKSHRRAPCKGDRVVESLIMLADLPGHHEIAVAGDYIVRATAAEDIDELARTYLAAYPPDVGAVDLPAARLAMDETFRGDYGEFCPAASPRCRDRRADRGSRAGSDTCTVARYAGLPLRN